MAGRNAAILVVKAAAIIGLLAVGLAIALIAWQERILGAAGASDPSAVAGIGAHLRIALLLLLAAAVALILVALLVTRMLPLHSERPAVEQPPSGGNPPETAGGELPAASALPFPMARFGHLVSVASLLRGFCHELNNELGPVQGYAELLSSDVRLSELHRRQVARIRDATRMAIADIRSFSAALGWSNDPAHVTRLADMAAEAARSAQAAITTAIEIDIAGGADVEVTATESDVGQAILHLCAAAAPLLGKQEARIRVQVDSVVGASSATADDLSTGNRLEMWSDPLDPLRTKVQFGALRPSWRYGRVRIEFAGHGWSRDLVGRMFDIIHPEEATTEVAAMILLGTLMSETGGAIMVDTCPDKHTSVALLWPARIAPEVAAPLELDAREDELDALIIHASESAAEEISRHLTDLGLRVASTTSTDAAMELVAEMGPKCRAVVVAQSGASALAARLLNGAGGPRLIQVEAAPDAQDLERLAAELRRPEAAT